MTLLAILSAATLLLSGCSAFPDGLWYGVGGGARDPLPTLATLQACVDEETGAQVDDVWELSAVDCEDIPELEVYGSTATLYGPIEWWIPITGSDSTGDDADSSDSVEFESVDFESVDFDVERLRGSDGSPSGRPTWRLTSSYNDDLGDMPWLLDCEAQRQELRCETVASRAGSSDEAGLRAITFIHEEHPLVRSQR